MAEKLTPQQQNLVINNLSLVHVIIYSHIMIDPNNPDYEYADLYQSGCVALCIAASKYNYTCSFQHYAGLVIHRYLLDYCTTANRQSHRDALDEIELAADEDGYCEKTAEIIYILEEIRQRTSGITRKGIEAITLAIKGMNYVEIAGVYDVKPNHVRAWVSRARKKIQNELWRAS